MRALVTGASGFLGGRLTQILHGHAEAVTVLVRPKSDLHHLHHLGRLRVVRGGLTDADALAEAARDATHIFHCAAASTDWAAAETYWESNVAGTASLLKVAGKLPRLERLVHVSTTDVYGYPEVPCTESGMLQDVGLPYNRTKILAENLVWRAAEEQGIPVTVLRPATIYGPRGKAFVADIVLLLKKRQMVYIGKGQTRGGFLYVDNAVEAMLAAACSAAAHGQAYNLTDQTGTTWKDYVTRLAGGLGYRLPWINIPFRQAMMLAAAMEAPYRWIERLPGRPPLTRHAVYLLGRDQEFPSEKARRHFGFTPSVSIEEGIARSVSWVLSQCRD